MAEDLKAELKATTDAMLINEASMEEGKLEMQFGPDGRVIPQSVRDLFCTSGNGQKHHVAKGKAIIAELRALGETPSIPKKLEKYFKHLM